MIHLLSAVNGRERLSLATLPYPRLCHITKNLGQASFGAIGALVGFLFGVIIKLACCGYIAYCFYNAVQ